VRTTLPRLPSSAARHPVSTSRLYLRPLAPSDLDALYELQLQPEVMRWTAAGRPVAHKDETAAKLAQFLPPHDIETFNCAICLAGDEDGGGTLIGIGGVKNEEGSYGWPELGYLLRKEYWGTGLATEFVRAFLSMWEDLDRMPIELSVNAKTLAGEVVDEDGSGMVSREQLVAIVDSSNAASYRIVEKLGFEK
ncbi:acyl-CoA N-acyltransferase, partial [Cryphonectria parasitica EP155]